ncbi:hypothetical protein JCM24511_07514 [Saitozyma sp. JCM 24511]|nr:hypothetical protein JCM24511_07514 [Saitozyma sp. JCM 24511]
MQLRALARTGTGDRRRTISVDDCDAQKAGIAPEGRTDRKAGAVLCFVDDRQEGVMAAVMTRQLWSVDKE